MSKSQYVLTIFFFVINHLYLPDTWKLKGTVIVASLAVAKFA